MTGTETEGEKLTSFVAQLNTKESVDRLKGENLAV